MIISFNFEKKEFISKDTSLLYEEEYAKVYVGNDEKQRVSIHKQGDEQLVFVGTIENKHDLTYVFNTIFTTEESNAEFLFKLINHVGIDQAISLVEGVYLVLYIKENKYQLFNDFLGQYPLYYCFEENNTFTAFSRVRDLPLNLKQKLVLKTKEEVLNPAKDIDFAPFSSYKRLISGKIVSFTSAKNGTVIDKNIRKVTNSFYHQTLQPNSGKHFLTYLENRTNEIGKHIPEHIAIPLSGGIDSGMVAGLFNAQGKKINSYSIGTDFSDEYVEAQQTADYLKTNHKTLHLSDDKILTLIEQLISFNEMFDPLAVEILLPFGVMFEAAQKDGLKAMCTGYGSDLILGGTLKNTAQNSIFDASVKLTQRTFWTNEFSPFYSKHFGIDLYHPFWSSKLIHYGLNIAADKKIKNEIEKHIFRAQADNTALLPKETVWRKKIGIHEGSSINKLMVKALGCSSDKLPDFIYQQYEKCVLKNELFTV